MKATNRSLLIPLTVLFWLVGTLTYGYLWIEYVLRTETLYGYERSRLLIGSAFVVYKVPYLLIALVIVLVLELLLVTRSHYSSLQ
ncbi:MAG TPA: hypothetical protein VE863_03240 [Pyrinomonadaceae bacterium]|jgi:hypothetical protein|nr:hypothetical protein [Pyrinomonadaceae bacterium]